jgi:hypothetical protein
MSILVAMMLAASPAPPRDCEKGAESMSQVLGCLYDLHQQRLDAAYNDTLSVVRHKDKNAANFLATAEKSWTKFALDSCDYTAAASHREIPEDARVNCWATFVDARIKVLQAYRREFTSSQTR